MEVKEKVFRAWDMEEKKMTAPMTFWMCMGYFAACVAKGQDLNRYRIMESIGLTDKKGITIFEGDIMQQVITTPFGIRYIKGVMEYNRQMAQYGTVMEITDDDPIGSHFEVKESVSGRPEVIGNIYENADLLHGMPKGSRS